MDRKQQGGVVAFVVVTLSLFLVLVAGVWAAREYGPEISETADEITISSTEGATDEEAEDATESDEMTDDQATSSDDDAEEPTQDAQETDQTEATDEDAAGVVEVPDEQNGSTDSEQTDDGTLGAISNTGPSEIAETGPASLLSMVIPLTALTATSAAYVRSRLSLSL